MTAAGIGQIVFYAVVLIGLGVPLGAYMARVYSGNATLARRILGPLERLLYRAFGVAPDAEMTWKQYALALLAFNVAGIAVVYGLQRLQGVLPGNPLDLPAVDPRVAFNTAISFGTNTNWQAYAGEATMSHLVQALALGVQNFVSAATGMAVLVALARAWRRKHADGIGSFWVDLTRSTIYILVPLSIVTALLLVWQGVPQTTDGREIAALLDAQPGAPPADAPHGRRHGAADHRAGDRGRPGRLAGRDQAARHQRGRVLQRELGAPAREPHAAVEPHRVRRDPADPGGALLHVRPHGGSRRQGVALLVTMTLLVVPFLALTLHQEQAGNPALVSLDVDQGASQLRPAATWRARRCGTASRRRRCGPPRPPRPPTARSTRCTTASRRSAGWSAIALMALGEVAFGGVGSGLYGLLIFAIVAVFIAGLMVGRTPELLGKKLESYEMKMASLAILVPVAAALIGTALACAGRRDLRQGARQPRPARVLRGPLRVHLAEQQQRLGVRRPDRERDVLRDRRRDLHVDCALLDHHPDARGRGLARAQEARPTVGGHAADRQARCSFSCSPAR